MLSQGGLRTVAALVWAAVVNPIFNFLYLIIRNIRTTFRHSCRRTLEAGSKNNDKMRHIPLPISDHVRLDELIAVPDRCEKGGLCRPRK
ncbi:hypothetical protein PQR72_09085 [Paraburkholderia madseniana]|uniref:hypothetical protein n=1 Tax=Paraburkholderia madseniana TaxID=2599607 RepID=UPI0038BDC90E